MTCDILTCLGAQIPGNHDLALRSFMLTETTSGVYILRSTDNCHRYHAHDNLSGPIEPDQSSHLIG